MKNVVLIILILACCLLSYNIGRRSAPRSEAYSDTLRITVVDTITERVPVPVDSVVVRYITKAISVTDTIYNIRIKDSVVLVTLPIMQQHYTAESYDAWVSGFEPRLDSVKIYNRIEREVIRQQPRRWGIGISAGAGATTEGIRPYIGVGITYTLF